VPQASTEQEKKSIVKVVNSSFLFFAANSMVAASVVGGFLVLVGLFVGGWAYMRKRSTAYESCE